MITPLLIIVAWLVVGALVGLYEGRRGHWRRGWAMSAVFGPLAIPLAWERRHLVAPDPVVLRAGHGRGGAVDLLVGLDGSPGARGAAELAVRLFGPALGRVTLASVIDVEARTAHDGGLLDPGPVDEERAARTDLAEAESALRRATGCDPGTVVLSGVPADALQEHALADGYEVLVVGCRGRGLTTRLLGSCASALAERARLPVLLLPSPAPSTPAT